MIIVQLPKLQQADVLAKQPIQLNALLVGEADGYTSHKTAVGRANSSEHSVWQQTHSQMLPQQMPSSPK